MSERHRYTHQRGQSLGPRIIDRTPLIVQREPETTHTCPNSQPGTRSRSQSLFRFPHLFSRTNNTVIITERRVRRAHRDDEVSELLVRPTSSRGRLPEPPNLVRPRTSRSVPPSTREPEMPPTQGNQGFVPLPDKLPRYEERTPYEYEYGGGQESNTPQAAEQNVEVVDEPDKSRRQPRPYSSRPTSYHTPLADQEQVLEPSSPRRQPTEHYEVYTPNEPVRSRQRGQDVRNNKEYIRMKEIAEHNYKAAEDAAKRCSSAEVRLQNLQRQLADMTLQQNKTAEEKDELQRKLENALRELNQCRREHHITDRERILSLHEAELAKDQLALRRQQAEERDRDLRRSKDKAKDKDKDRGKEKVRDDSGGSGSGKSDGKSHRHSRHRVFKVHDDRIDSSSAADHIPRTPDPQANTANAAKNILQGSSDTNVDKAGMDAIDRARAEAAAKKGKAQ